MRFYDNGVGVGTVPSPVNPMPRDAMEVARLAEKAALLDKEPNLAFEHVINLLRLMRMRRGVIARRSNRVHEAAFIAVTPPDDHRAFAFNPAANDFAFRHLGRFYMERHRRPPIMARIFARRSPITLG